MPSSARVRLPLAFAAALLLSASATLFPNLLYSDALAATSADMPALESVTIVGATSTRFVDEIPAPAPEQEAPRPVTSYIPIRIDIPGANIHAPVIGVATNEKGEMDVPDGSSESVGWYERGVKPGRTGTAVFDAHVFAAFRRLDRVRVGADIYVTTTDGSKLHFKVTKSSFYKLSGLSTSTLFAPSDTRDINLITCAGAFIPSHNTYDHRLIVSATLVD